MSIECKVLYYTKAQRITLVEIIWINRWAKLTVLWMSAMLLLRHICLCAMESWTVSLVEVCCRVGVGITELHVLTSVWLQLHTSVQFSHSVVSDSLQLHGLQYPRLLCPSQVLEPAQSLVHQVSDVTQPSHPLSSTSPAFNLYQHPLCLITY